MVFATSLVMVMTLSMITHAESRPAYGKKLVASLLEEPLVVDPLLARSHTDMTVIGLLFDTLYRIEGGQLLPHLAVSLPDHSDPLQVRITLIPDVRFHDGSVMRAQDVVASLQRLQKSELGYLLETVERIEVGAVNNVEAAAPPTVVFAMRKADPTLARRLANLHSAIVLRGEAPQWRRIVGSGPWKLKTRSMRARTLTLESHSSYFGGRPYLDELVLHWYEHAAAEARQYEAGASQVSARGQIAFAGHRPKYSTKSMEANIRALAYLGFGKASAITAETDFRRAVSAAIGRWGMREIGSGESISPSNAVLRPRLKPRRFAMLANPKLAARLLQTLSSRYPALEAKTQSLRLIVNRSRPDDAEVAARVAAALFAHGIKTKIEVLPAKTFARRSRSGLCDLYIGQLAPGRLLPTDLLRKAFVIAGHVKTAYGLTGKSRTAIERRFDRELPMLPLFHRALRLHYRGDVGGVRPAALRYSDLFYYGEPVTN